MIINLSKERTCTILTLSGKKNRMSNLNSNTFAGVGLAEVATALGVCLGAGAGMSSSDSLDEESLDDTGFVTWANNSTNNNVRK